MLNGVHRPAFREERGLHTGRHGRASISSRRSRICAAAEANREVDTRSAGDQRPDRRINSNSRPGAEHENAQSRTSHRDATDDNIVTDSRRASSPRSRFAIGA